MTLDVFRRVPAIDWDRLPYALRGQFAGKVSAVCTSMDECQALDRWFGDSDFCPYLPILLVIPGQASVTQVEGRGVTTVAELRDLCVTTWGRAEERMAANGGKLFDFDALRAKHGLPSREEADDMIREAMWERAVKHRKNSRTDPAREPWATPRQSFAVNPHTVED